ncbi:hypothetical protein PIB30_075309 [Stylosanthes scabra]|uniref:Uncharacterized protein n=1 Tax=Stylosanthes scabra TaxID=79078 RepID=A0ABU6VRT2_9FABA|nr:hypothetical protein [Stylosanthes scabra]
MEQQKLKLLMATCEKQRLIQEASIEKNKAEVERLRALQLKLAAEAEQARLLFPSTLGFGPFISNHSIQDCESKFSLKSPISVVKLSIFLSELTSLQDGAVSVEREASEGLSFEKMSFQNSLNFLQNTGASAISVNSSFFDLHSSNPFLVHVSSSFQFLSSLPLRLIRQRLMRFACVASNLCTISNKHFGLARLRKKVGAAIRFLIEEWRLKLHRFHR